MMTTLDAKTWRAARAALESAVLLHLDDPNVSLIDLGYRTRSSQGHRLESELAVRVHVRRKLHGAAFERFASRHPHWVIEAKKIGFAVDVPEACYQPSRRVDGNETLHGGVVHDRQTGQAMFLTSRTALLDSFSAISACNARSSPGGSDGQNGAATIFVRDGLGKHLDAAVARLHGQVVLDEQRAHVVAGPALPQLGMHIMQLCGDRMESTGIITGILGCGLYRRDGEIRLIRHLIHIVGHVATPEMKHAHDAGAWWVDADEDGIYRAVGLHFTGSVNGQFTLALSMPEVLRALDVDLIAREARRSLHVPNHENAVDRRVDQSEPKEDSVLFTVRQRAAQLAGLAMKSAPIALALFAAGKFYDHEQAAVQRQKKAVMALQATVAHLQSSIEIDSMRMRSLQTIVTIIDRFNPGMAVQLKHRIADEIYQMTLKYPNLDVELICATITHESGRTWNPRVVSPAGAMGLMQIMPSTGVILAREEAIPWKSSEEVLFDPIQNIRLGCRYLSSLVGAYDIDGGLAAYNGGARRAERWLSSGRADGILHAETTYYVPAILKIYEQYRRKNI